MADSEPTKRISEEAIKVTNEIFKLLKTVPQNEWRFILLWVRDEANEEIKKSEQKSGD